MLAKMKPYLAIRRMIFRNSNPRFADIRQALQSSKVPKQSS